MFKAIRLLQLTIPLFIAIRPQPRGSFSNLFFELPSLLLITMHSSARRMLWFKFLSLSNFLSLISNAALRIIGRFSLIRALRKSASSPERRVEPRYEGNSQLSSASR